MEEQGRRKSRSEGMEVERVREKRWRREEERDGWEKRWRREEERIELRGEGLGHLCTPM